MNNESTPQVKTATEVAFEREAKGFGRVPTKVEGKVEFKGDPAELWLGPRHYFSSVMEALRHRCERDDCTPYPKPQSQRQLTTDSHPTWLSDMDEWYVKTDKTCICPMHGPTGIIAIGCQCGGK